MKDEEELFTEEDEENVNDNILVTIYEENRKLIWILIAVILLILLMVIFGKTSSNSNNSNNNSNSNDSNSTITMSSKVETISVHTTKQLSAKVSNDSNPTIIWTSSNNNVATIDSTGSVYGLSEGKTTITATYKDSNGKVYTTTCEVTVVEGTVGIELKSIKFKDGSIIMSPNSTYDLTYEKDPYNAMVKENIFSSTNEQVAKVDRLTGKVTAVAIGTSTIRVSVNNVYTASINVYVMDKNISPGIYKLPTSITFREDVYNIEVGDTKKLSYTYTPAGADSSFMEFTSNNSKVATIDENGYVKGISAGDANITITSGGAQATTKVHVTNKVIEVSSINVSDNNVKLEAGKTHQIVVTYSPKDATNKELVYESNNPSVVTVNSSGLVTGISAGSTYVKVSSKTNSRASVNVFFKVTGSSSPSPTPTPTPTPTPSGDGVATVKITSNNDSVENSYANALNNPKNSYPTLTIKANGNSSYIKYCTYAYGSGSTCTPNIVYTGPFELRRTGLTVIKAQAVYNGKEGDVLTRYVNIKFSSGTTNTNSCYCNANGKCTYGTKTNTYTVDVGIPESLCRAYISRNYEGCFVYGGQYVWGSHLGKTSSYVYISSITSKGACSSGSYPIDPGTPAEPTPTTPTFNVRWNKSYGYNVGIDRARILQYDVESESRITRVYFCESSSTSKCTININSATRRTKHFDLRVLSSSVYDTGSNYNKTYYFDDINGTNFRFFIATQKEHSVTVLATDANNRVSSSFSTTAQ